MDTVAPQASELHLSRWNELPKIDLYMDQLVSIGKSELDAIGCPSDDSLLTKSMVNNYVKAKLIPAPYKKHYRREQIAALVFVVMLKSVLSMQELTTLQDGLLREFSDDRPTLHDYYCSMAEAVITHLRQETPPTSLLNTEVSPYKRILTGALFAYAYRLDAQRQLMEMAALAKEN